MLRKSYHPLKIQIFSREQSVDIFFRRACLREADFKLTPSFEFFLIVKKQ